MDAKRHARLTCQPCALLAGHVVRFRSLDVSVERSSPRGYAFFVPLGGGESRFRFTPTFTGHGYYSKKRRVCARRFYEEMARKRGVCQHERNENMKQMIIDERNRSEFLIGLGRTIPQTASELGRSPATIRNELVRHSVGSNKRYGCSNMLCAHFDECVQGPLGVRGQNPNCPSANLIDPHPSSNTETPCKCALTLAAGQSDLPDRYLLFARTPSTNRRPRRLASDSSSACLSKFASLAIKK